MEFNFQEQLLVGQIGEDVIDSHLLNKYGMKAEKVSPELDQLGVDRIIRGGLGTTWSAEYKTDFVAGKTHNAFIETVSVDSSNKLGWSRTSIAQWILYYVPPDGLLYFLETTEVKKKIDEWCSKYRIAKAQNSGYFSHGVIVPLAELEAISFMVDSKILVVSEAREIKA